MSASRRASYRRTSRSCRRRNRRHATESEHTVVVEEGRDRRLDLARTRRLARRDQRSSRCSGREPRGRLKEGQKLRVLLPRPASVTCSRCASSLPATAAIEAAVALSDTRQLCAGRHPERRHRSRRTRARTKNADDDGSGVRLYQSIYETALRNNIPRPVIEEMVRIYSYDVDFQRKVQPGDSFDVLYAEDEPTATARTKCATCR